MSDCSNCGRCCHFIVENEVVACPHLQWNNDGTTNCKVYATRIGRKIHSNPDKYCGMRSQSKYDFKNCPMNTNKPIIPIYDEDFE